MSVVGDWPEVIDEVQADFAWFADRADAGGGLRAWSSERAPSPDVIITVERRPPDFDHLGDLSASFVTPRNVVYRSGERAVIDYFGEAVSIYERATGRLRVQGLGVDLVHEAVYLFVLSRVGEHLERIGRPRLHALGLSGRQGGVAVMLPSGGGKSTLAVNALAADGVKLLSEDSPLIDRQGLMHPFPLRLGVNPGDADELPRGRVRTLQRMEFHPKTLLDVTAFADRIEPEPVPLRHLVLGRRTLGRRAALEPLARGRLAGPLLRECVVGVGLYQGMEFVLQRGMRDVFGKLQPAGVRLACSARALTRAQPWQLTLGRDREANWAALAPVLTQAAS